MSYVSEAPGRFFGGIISLCGEIPSLLSSFIYAKAGCRMNQWFLKDELGFSAIATFSHMTPTLHAL